MSWLTLGQLIIVIRKVFKVFGEWVLNTVVIAFSFIQIWLTWQLTRSQQYTQGLITFLCMQEKEKVNLLVSCESVLSLSDPNSLFQTIPQWQTADAQINSHNINCAHIKCRMLFVCSLSTVYGMISLTGGMNIIPISHYLPYFLGFLLCECAGGCRTPRGLCLWL